MSRSRHAQAACPRSQHQLNKPGRDLKSNRPGRDVNPCRDLLDNQAYVATSSSCRDLNSQQARSRRQFHVATSWRLSDVTTSFPCRDIPHCRPCRDVKTMSLHQIISASSLLHRDAMSRPPLLPPMSRRQHDVATSTPTCCNSARSRRPVPGRDLVSNHTRSRPHIHVATSNRS